MYFVLTFLMVHMKIKQRLLAISATSTRLQPYNIAILGDLQGPKLRVGEMENGKLEIVPGDILTFTSKEKVIGTNGKNIRFLP